MADERKHALLAITQATTVFIALLLQQYGLLTIWTIHEISKYNVLLGSIQRKQNYRLQKLKFAKQRRLLRKKRKNWVAPGKTDQWWDNMTGEIVPEENWKKNFRMLKESFHELVQELMPYISHDNCSSNYRASSAVKKVAITLHYLKDTGSLIMTANLFGIAVCTVSSVISQVCKAIAMNLEPKCLKLPGDDQEMRQKISKFETKYGMVQAFGCIDGTHIPIKRPIKDPQDSSFQITW